MIKRIGALVFAFTLLFAFAVPASADYDAEYIYYDSLVSSGTQYINTDVVGSSDLRFVVDFKFNTALTGGQTLFGSESTSNDRMSLSVQVFTNELKFFYGGAGTLTFTNLYDGGAVNTLDIDLSVGSATFNGQTQSFTPVSLSNGRPVYLFAYNQNGTANNFANATIYSCRVYKGGDLIRSFTPSSPSSGYPGMWDLVNDVFYPNSGTGVFSTGDVFVPPVEEDTVAKTIVDLNNQIHDIEVSIYEDLHTYSAQIDPSTATNFSGNFLSAMSFISDTWTSAYNQLGDMQVIVTFPLFLAIAMLFIGRMNSVIASGAMKSRKNNDKKGGGDVG